MNESGLSVQQPGGELMSVEQHRAIQEVQASMIIAKKFPRDVDAAYLRIMKACERHSLADQAEYAYPRGDGTVTGPTIRLAEVMAQNWGNLQFGIRELSQSGGESEIEAFAWDLETNTRQIKTFKVPHKRYTKARGNVDLTDPRDIYEYVANQGARRMRACILGIIPGDITEAALEKCKSTVKKGVDSKPIEDQIRVVLKRFDSLGVTKEMIERRLNHGTELITADELVELIKIGRSIQDNMTSREEWFDLKAADQKKAKDLTDKIKNGTQEKTNATDYKATELKDEEKGTIEPERPGIDVPEKSETAEKGGISPPDWIDKMVDEIGGIKTLRIMAMAKGEGDYGDYTTWHPRIFQAFKDRFQHLTGETFEAWAAKQEKPSGATVHGDAPEIEEDTEDPTIYAQWARENTDEIKSRGHGGVVKVQAKWLKLGLRPEDFPIKTTTPNGNDAIPCPDKDDVATTKAYCESNCNRGDDKCEAFLDKWA